MADTNLLRHVGTDSACLPREAVSKLLRIKLSRVLNRIHKISNAITAETSNVNSEIPLISTKINERRLVWQLCETVPQAP